MSEQSDSGRLSRQGLLLLVALSLFWGGNWSVMKMVLTEVPPLYFRGGCLVLSGLGMLILVRLNGIPIRIPRTQWKRVLWITLFNITVWNTLIIFGIERLPSGRASLLGYTMPLWSTLLSMRFLGERLMVRAMFGLLSGVAGIMVLVSGVEGLGEAPLGVLYMLLGAWSWAAGVVLFKRFPVAMPMSSLTGWMMLIGGLPMFVLAIPLESSRLVIPGLGPIFGMLYCVFISLMFCYWAWNRIMQMVPVSVSSISSLAAPLISVFCGAIFLGEAFDWREILAATLILCAVGSVSLKR